MYGPSPTVYFGRVSWPKNPRRDTSFRSCRDIEQTTRPIVRLINKARGVAGAAEAALEHVRSLKMVANAGSRFALRTVLGDLRQSGCG